MTRARRIAAVMSALVQGSLVSSCVLVQLGSNLEELEQVVRFTGSVDGERFTFLREPLCLGPGEEHSDLTLRLSERWGDVALDPLHEVIDAERFRTGDRVGLEHPQFARSGGEHGMWRQAA